MNFLAHSYLSKNDDESVIGNMIADFVKGRLKQQYSPGILAGIEFHRKIDSFTDTHPIFLDCKQLISDENRRFAGVILDIFFDHFLAVNWNKYSSIPLEQHAQHVYSILQKNQHNLTLAFQLILPSMIKNNWFVSYKKIKVIGYALDNVSNRISKENSVSDAVNDLQDNYGELEERFFAFFGELEEYADDIGYGISS